jgi:hypothetical protein
MKLLISFFMVLSAVLFAFVSCDDGDAVEIPPIEKFPSLKVENEAVEKMPLFNIYAVELAGYEFEQLIIPVGDSQLFILDQGMPEGFEQINVEIQFGTIGFDWSETAVVNFENGKTSTITLKGCELGEGCQGYYIE